MRYVVTKNEDGQFTGFCGEPEFEKNRELFLLDGETYEIFEGPECDGSDDTFALVKQLAVSRCRV